MPPRILANAGAVAKASQQRASLPALGASRVRGVAGSGQWVRPGPLVVADSTETAVKVPSPKYDKV